MSETLFDLPEPAEAPEKSHACTGAVCGVCHPDRKGRHRRNDQPTSIEGAKAVRYRAGTQKALLLQAFHDALPGNLTDEEAARIAGVSLSSEFAKRCGELRQDGVIRQVDGVTRPGGSGVNRLMSIAVIDNSHLEGGGTTLEQHEPEYVHSVCVTCGGHDAVHHPDCERLAELDYVNPDIGWPGVDYCARCGSTRQFQHECKP